MASLSALIQNKKDAEKKLKQYEKRLKEVKSIHGDLDKACQDYVSDINEKVRSALTHFGDGLNTGGTNVESILSPVFQSGAYEDSSLSGCRSNLGNEITRINGEIEELKRDIRLLESSIADAEDELLLQ